MKSETDITAEVFGEDDGVPVIEVEYEKGYAPFSPHEVIVTLAEEFLALRTWTLGH